MLTDVAIVSCDEFAMSLKDVFTEEKLWAGGGKKRVLLRTGFLSVSGVFTGAAAGGPAGCFPLNVFVNLAE